MFRPAVMAAIDDAVFTPAELDGDPMPYWLILGVRVSHRPGPGRSDGGGPR